MYISIWKVHVSAIFTENTDFEFLLTNNSGPCICVNSVYELKQNYSYTAFLTSCNI